MIDFQCLTSVAEIIMVGDTRHYKDSNMGQKIRILPHPQSNLLHKPSENTQQSHSHAEWLESQSHFIVLSSYWNTPGSVSPVCTSTKYYYYDWNTPVLKVAADWGLLDHQVSH